MIDTEFTRATYCNFPGEGDEPGGTIFTEPLQSHDFIYLGKAKQQYKCKRCNYHIGKAELNKRTGAKNER